MPLREGLVQRFGCIIKAILATKSQTKAYLSGFLTFFITIQELLLNQ
jgi:hypothetical protein